MEKTKKIMRYIFAICILVLYFYTYKKTPTINDDCAMIDYAESCIRNFNEQTLHRIVARNNYYYCTYNGKATSYIVSNNFQYIRQISSDTMKTIMKEDIKGHVNGERLIALLHIVESLKKYDISEVEVNANVIKISKFNGYYLTNNTPQYKSNLRQIKDGWFANE